MGWRPLYVGLAVLGPAISTVRAAWAVEEATAAATYVGIGATKVIGENFLKTLGGKPQEFFRTSLDARYIDQLVAGVAHESKVGAAYLTKFVERQIQKDMELLMTRQISGSVWHFFTSPVTGLSGPSAALLNALHHAGIKVVIH